MSDRIKADCRLDFMPAYRTSGTRPVGKIKWIVLHDTEGGTAYSVARYFQSSTANGSAHLIVDDNRCYRSLPNTAVPWAAPGANEAGFHIEQCAFASWTRDEWLLHGSMLRRAAFKTAYHCRLFGLPAVFRWADDLQAGKKGVTTHAQVTLAFPGPGHDHTDPGANWPKDKFMEWVRLYYQALGAGV